MYNHSTSIPSVAINATTGELYTPSSSSSHYRTTSLINIHNVKNLFFSFYNNYAESGTSRAAFYDKNYVLLRVIDSANTDTRPSGLSATSSEKSYKEWPLLTVGSKMIPENAEYVRFSFKNTPYVIIMKDVIIYKYTFPKPVYGGELDVLNNKLTITKNFIANYDPEDPNNPNIDFSQGGWISSTGSYNPNEQNIP